MKTSSRLLRSSGFFLGILAVAFACDCFLSSAIAQSRAGKAATKFDLSMIDAEMVKEFRQAWMWSENGTSDIEGLVLIFRRLDGSYKAVAQKPTNENRRFTFRWSADVIAIVHSHPNKIDPKPLGADLALANHFGVPNLTITSRGMYIYNPGTKKTTKVKEGLDWLNSANGS